MTGQHNPGQHNFEVFITAKRTDQGISQHGMAEQLGITAAYLSDIEKNRHQQPEKPLLGKKADALFLLTQKVTTCMT